MIIEKGHFHFAEKGQQTVKSLPNYLQSLELNDLPSQAATEVV